MSDRVYKLLRDVEWLAAKDSATFGGAPVDHEDGFIHFSTLAQVAETARRYFSGENPLHVLAIDPWQLPVGQLKWEPSRGGDLFPHLYGPLPMAAVAAHHVLVPDARGDHDFSCLSEGENE